MKARGIVNILAANAIGLAMGLGAVEIGVRLFADTGMQYELEMWRYALEAKQVSAVEAMGHEHVPDVNTVLMGAPVSINAIGLRDDPVATAKPADTVRVLMLGDSITFGWGVADEERVSERLEAALAGHSALRGRRLEVINAGVGNYNAAMSVAWHLNRGRALEPDIIVFNYFINDAEPRPSRQGGLLRETSAAYVFFAGKVDTAMRLMEERRDWRDYYAALYDEAAPGFQAMSDSFTRLAEAARADGAPVLFAVYPELRELAPYPFQRETDIVAGLARGHGWPVIDLLPAVAATPPEELWVTVPDPHPNGRANALFAQALTAPLAALLAHGTE